MHALVLFFWLLLVLGFMAPHESLLVAFECARDDDADKKKNALPNLRTIRLKYYYKTPSHTWSFDH